MSMISVTKMGSLKGLFGLPLPKKTITVAEVSSEMKAVNAAGSKLKPLAKDTLSLEPWYVCTGTDKILYKMEAQATNADKVKELEDGINTAFGSIEI